MWWTCPEAMKYWKKIRKWIQEIVGEDIDLAPETFLLGILKRAYGKKKRYLIIHITTAARLIYAQYWKEKGLPPEEHIIRKVFECAEMSKLTYEINEDENSDYYTVWEGWYKWMDDKIKEGVRDGVITKRNK